MTIRTARYWDELVIALVAARVVADREGCGIRVAWLEGGPVIRASLDVPHGLVEEMHPK